MIKCCKSRTLASALALIMGAMVLMTPLTSYAAQRPAEFWQKTKVNGDGVRLRTEPVTGAILGLMYMDETIWLSSRSKPNYPSWCYLWREKHEQIGWMEISYYVHI